VFRSLVASGVSTALGCSVDFVWTGCCLACCWEYVREVRCGVSVGYGSFPSWFVMALMVAILFGFSGVIGCVHDGVAVSVDDTTFVCCEIVA